MALQARRTLHRQLLQKRAAAAKRFPNRFAAYSLVKPLASSIRPGKPLRTASVFYDKRNSRLGRAVASEFERRGIKTRALGLVPMLPAKMPPEQRAEILRMSRADSVVFAATDRRGELEKMTRGIERAAERRRGQKVGTRLAMMYGITPRATKELLTADAKPMRRFTRKTLRAVEGSRRVRVRTANGTDISFWLSRGMRWVADSGVISKNYWGNLPAGEVFTSPLTANGVLVLDGIMNNVGMLGKAPITVRIRNGRVVPQSVSCRDARLRERFLRAVSEDGNAGRIGELGLGTNMDVKKLTGNDLVDEKFPGVHVGFGDPLASDTGANWKSAAHNDAILRKPTIIVDGRVIMRGGKTLFR